MYLLGCTPKHTDWISTEGAHQTWEDSSLHTQLMGVGRAGMGGVSLLLPGCCHGDADGAFIASWDLAPHTHTPLHVWPF